MRRFWADRRLFFHGKTVLLKGDLFRHITKVCRIQKGESFLLLAGGAQKHRVRLISTGPSFGKALVEETFPLPPPPKPDIHLFLSLPRLKTADAVLEKAAELDVKSFQPFVSEFSFLKKNPAAFSEGKFKRWRSLADAAAAQSLRAAPLEIFPLKRFQDLSFSAEKTVLRLMAYEGGGAAPLDLKSLSRSSPSQIALFVGSEGGFSHQEAEFFQKKGGRLFSLGERILRVETACIAALSLLKHAFHH